GARCASTTGKCGRRTRAAATLRSRSGADRTKNRPRTVVPPVRAGNGCLQGAGEPTGTSTAVVDGTRTNSVRNSACKGAASQVGSSLRRKRPGHCLQAASASGRGDHGTLTTDWPFVHATYCCNSRNYQGSRSEERRVG